MRMFSPHILQVQDTEAYFGDVEDNIEALHYTNMFVWSIILGMVGRRGGSWPCLYLLYNICMANSLENPENK